MGFLCTSVTTLCSMTIVMVCRIWLVYDLIGDRVLCGSLAKHPNARPEALRLKSSRELFLLTASEMLRATSSWNFNYSFNHSLLLALAVISQTLLNWSRPELILFNNRQRVLSSAINTLDCIFLSSRCPLLFALSSFEYIIFKLFINLTK